MHVLSLFAPCVAPPAARSRTLQWDTDPSVLQLQADSELGYFLPPLSFLLFLFSLMAPLPPFCSFSLFVSLPVLTTVFQSVPVWPFIYLPTVCPSLTWPSYFQSPSFLSLSGLNAFSWSLSSCLPRAVYDIDWFILTSRGAECFFFFFIIFSFKLKNECHVCRNIKYFYLNLKAKIQPKRISKMYVLLMD